MLRPGFCPVLGECLFMQQSVFGGDHCSVIPMNIPGNSDDNPGKGNEPEPPEVPEPHVHGVQIDPQSGAYVSDEGEEECFF